MMRRYLILAMLASSCLAAGEPVSKSDPLILNETAYWRSYFVCRPVRIAPELLAAEGEKLLGKEFMDRCRKVSEKRQKGSGAEDGKLFVLRSLREGDGRSVTFYNEILGNLNTSPPARNWMACDFDDGDWTRQREPLLLGRPGYSGWTDGDLHHVQRSYYRTTFESPDPAQAAGLQFSATYRGGLRVFINGTELKRQHLPAGELSEDSAADPYPLEAYSFPAEFWGKECWNSGYDPKKSGLYLVPSLTAQNFESLPLSDPKNPAGPRSFGQLRLSRTAFDHALGTIMKLRDRKMDVPIPGNLLRKGTNVLAIELRASHIHPVQLKQGRGFWEDTGALFEHNWLVSARLSGELSGAPPPLRRPPGIQVWVEDIHHRVYGPEFHAAGRLPAVARMAGARNGVYSAQVVVGTDRELAQLKAEAGPLQAVTGGAVIPATSVNVLYGVPHPIGMMGQLGQDYKSPGAKEIVEWTADIQRHAGSANPLNPAERNAVLQKIMFFDHLSPTPPEKIPADSCQPLWLSMQIPAGATPGKYRGTARIQAAGMEPVAVALEVEVFDWRLPEGRQLRTHAAMEQSPYAVAKHYKVPLWSDRHFELLEKSIELLGKAGDDWLNIPVLAGTEFGNRDDSPLRVTRRKDGSYAFDYSIMDHYVALAIKHWGVPRVISFVVNQPAGLGGGNVAPPLELPVLDESTGQKQLMPVGNPAPGSEAARLWKELAQSLHAHMKALNLDKSMYWGLPWDLVADTMLVSMLAEAVPSVKWARQSHSYVPDATYTAVSTLFGFELGMHSKKGWKRSNIHLLFPRNQGDIITCWGPAAPFIHRLIVDRSLVGGANGVARLAGDLWDNTWYEGMKGQLWAPGIACLMLLWPGNDGAETSARYEILREGLQEGEIRIFLEQAEEKIKDPALKERITAVLERHSHDTMLIEPRTPYVKMCEYSSGWQSRSRSLYELAAEVARAVPVEIGPGKLAVALPARAKIEARVQLRNWTAGARSCKLSSEQDWIQPKLTDFKLEPGHSELAVVLDSGKLDPAREYKGSLVLADAASGWTETVEITAAVDKLLAVSVRVLNVEPSIKTKHPCVLQNKSGSELVWSLESSVPWITLSPKSGKLGPLEQVELSMETAPIEQESARLETALNVREAGGRTETLPLTVHVVPAYQPPAKAPDGAPIALRSLQKRKVVRGKDSDYFFAPTNGSGWRLGLGRVFEDGALLSAADCEIAFDIAGKGYTTFATEVCMNYTFNNPTDIFWATQMRLHFELHVDGKLQAQSGLMALSDAPRLLVAKGLEHAKELRLAVRQQTDEPSAQRIAYWGNPNFYAPADSPEAAAAIAAATASGRAIYLTSVDLSPAYAGPKDNPDQPFPPEIKAEKDKVEWKKNVRFYDHDQLSLPQVRGGGPSIVEYARVTLEAEAECKLRLSISMGNDVNDGIARLGLALFVNGQDVYRKSAQHRLKADERQVEIALTKGRNELLFRIVRPNESNFLQLPLRIMGLTQVKQIVAE